MKNEYNNKKRATIITLSFVAICLVAGLFYYVGTLRKTEPINVTAESQSPEESTVFVPEIKPEETLQPESEAVSSEAATEPIQESTVPIESETQTVSQTKAASNTAEKNPSKVIKESTAPAEKETQTKPSDEKPKSPEQAVLPTEPPAESDKVPVENPDAGGQCQPDQSPKPEPDQPQGGEKQDGKIYVPGFGWIEDHGGGSDVHEAPNAGTGKPVGEM